MLEIPHPLAAFLTDLAARQIPFPERVAFQVQSTGPADRQISLSLPVHASSPLKHSLWADAAGRSIKLWITRVSGSIGMDISELRFERDVDRDGPCEGLVRVGCLRECVRAELAAGVGSPWKDGASWRAQIELIPRGDCLVVDPDTRHPVDPAIIAACDRWAAPLAEAWPSLTSIRGTMSLPRPTAHEMACMLNGRKAE